MGDMIPREVTAEERWIAKNRVVGITVEYVQTGTDTAETYLKLTPEEGKPARWLAQTFRKVAKLDLSHASIASPAYGVREAVEAREKFEKANAAELATYKRLKEKFGATNDR